MVQFLFVYVTQEPCTALEARRRVLRAARTFGVHVEHHAPPGDTVSHNTFTCRAPSMEVATALVSRLFGGRSRETGRWMPLAPREARSLIDFRWPEEARP